MQYFQIRSLSKVRADNGGLAILNAGWKHPRRILTSSVLILGLKGSVELDVGGYPAAIIPGRLLLLPAESLHFGVKPVDSPASYYWIHFSCADEAVEWSEEHSDDILSNRDAVSHVLQDSALLPLEFDLPNPEKMKDAMRQLLNEQEAPSYTRHKFESLFRMILIEATEHIIRAHVPNPAMPSTLIGSQIVRYIAEHLADPNLSIKTISAESGLNLDYAGRRFKRTMGESVGEYILKQRIGLALARLQQSSETIDAIAAGAGFGSLRQFFRQFRSRTGMTPSEARNLYRRMHINSI